MPVNLGLSDLMDYTEWERQKWHGRLRQEGDEILKTSAGPHGDGRFATLGELIRHIFSAETRYVDRLSGRTITDTGSVPTDSLDALFQVGPTEPEVLKGLHRNVPRSGVGRPAGTQADEFLSKSNTQKDRGARTAA